MPVPLRHRRYPRFNTLTFAHGPGLPLLDEKLCPHATENKAGDEYISGLQTEKIMKEVIDWEAVTGCLGCLGLMLLIGVAAVVGYFLFFIILYLVLRPLAAILILLAIPAGIWFLFKAMFFKKVE